MDDCNIDFLFLLIKDFRNAIIEARSCCEFKASDRMSRFPNGCCDDACDLLAYYLCNVHKIHTEQFNGTYYDQLEPENTTNHNWLKYKDYIIDITYSQFSFITNSQEKIYFGKANTFYKSLERIHQIEHCDIRTNNRLWKDYQFIIAHLNSK